MPIIYGSSFVRPDPKGKEVCPHFQFRLILSEIPDEMTVANSDNGVYANQIRFAHRDSEAISSDEPHTLIVDIYCGGINPQYQDALLSLFGLDIGEILGMTSDDYMYAMDKHGDAFIFGASEYIGSLGVIEQLLLERQDDLLAQLVYQRLMRSSLFL